MNKMLWGGWKLADGFRGRCENLHCVNFFIV